AKIPTPMSNHKVASSLSGARACSVFLLVRDLGRCRDSDVEQARQFVCSNPIQHPRFPDEIIRPKLLRCCAIPQSIGVAWCPILVVVMYEPVPVPPPLVLASSGEPPLARHQASGASRKAHFASTKQIH